ncbi:MAG: hypothetical protein GWP18_00555 [Proteobacteria bacterium]|nr:hypothetical protein [Pseudomonadota bacterium]
MDKITQVMRFTGSYFARPKGSTHPTVTFRPPQISLPRRSVRRETAIWNIPPEHGADTFNPGTPTQEKE